MKYCIEKVKDFKRNLFAAYVGVVTVRYFINFTYSAISGIHLYSLKEIV